MKEEADPAVWSGALEGFELLYWSEKGIPRGLSF
jgi:hypothetical protein